jgi:hypothetical protein
LNIVLTPTFWMTLLAKLPKMYRGYEYWFGVNTQETSG